MVMLTVIGLVVLGLCLGSFVNALVWRLHEQEELRATKPKDWRKKLRELSIVRGRSMCPHCRRQLATKDLVPVLSWVSLHGKCRYCSKPIAWQYPAVELAVAVLFVLSYLWWPFALHGYGLFTFNLWLVFVVGFVALTVYDIRWFLLPDKLVWPLAGLALVQVATHVLLYGGDGETLLTAGLGVLVASGVFYLLYIGSKGKWIGGGDVKLGIIIGLLVGGPWPAFLVLYVASAAGTLVSLPLLARKKVTRTSLIPFGPFLLFATVVVQLVGSSIINWFNGLVFG
jgi:prepilin signal peptidase PulO-like enzyme (type II secretory pathway)